MAARPKPRPDQFLTTREATAYSGASVRSLHRWADQGRLHKHYLGTRLRWSRTEIDALLTDQRPAVVEATRQRLLDRRTKAGA